MLSSYHRISKDSRHRDVQLLLKHTVAQRSFGEWGMGYLPTAQDAHPDGFLDYMRDLPQLVTDGDSADRTLQLLQQFVDGRWRRKIR